MAKKLRIGVLGVGRIGKLHVTNLVNSVPDAEVVMVADPFLNDDSIAWANSLGITNCSKIQMMYLQILMWTQYLSALPQIHMLNLS